MIIIINILQSTSLLLFIYAYLRLITYGRSGKISKGYKYLCDKKIDIRGYAVFAKSKYIYIHINV